MAEDNLPDSGIEAFFAEFCSPVVEREDFDAFDPLAIMARITPGERAPLTRLAARLLRGYPEIYNDDDRAGDFLALVLNVLQGLKEIKETPWDE
jgi:hypothetical protein